MIRLSPRFIISVIPAVLLLGTTARAASSSMPLSHHGVAHGYRVTLPAGWAQIPDADLASRSRAAWKSGSANPIVFDSAFQFGRNRRSFEYPYVIVQVLPYRGIGLDRPIDEDEFPDLVRRMTAADVFRGVASQRPPRTRSRMSDARVDAPVLERSRRRFWMTGEMTVAGQGRVRALAAGYFGRDAMVQVCFYGKAVDWDRHATTGRRICESLKFDPAKDYPVAPTAATPTAATPAAATAAAPAPTATNPAVATPAAANPTPQRNSNWTIMKVVIGAIGGAAAGLISHAARRRRGTPADEIDPAMNRPRPW